MTDGPRSEPADPPCLAESTDLPHPADPADPAGLADLPHPADPADPPGAGTDGDRRRRGSAVRREVLGDRHVDRAAARTDELTADFQDFITRYAWGEIWTRPGLDRRTRSCVTLAVLAALHHDEELALHVRAALRNGLTEAEVAEVLLQVGVYAGVPAANRAFSVAQRALRQEDT